MPSRLDLDGKDGLLVVVIDEEVYLPDLLPIVIVEPMPMGDKLHRHGRLIDGSEIEGIVHVQYRLDVFMEKDGSQDSDVVAVELDEILPCGTFKREGGIR